MSIVQGKGENASLPDGRRALGQGTPRLLTREELMQALWRQRAYADRMGTPFVFIRVGLTQAAWRGGGRAWGERLGRLACGLCRASDAAGWCNERGDCVGVLMPGATAHGALRVVRELEAAVGAGGGAQAHALEVACEVFVYPGAALASAEDWAVGGLDAERV